jgi:hypothetical protein
MVDASLSMISQGNKSTMEFRVAGLYIYIFHLSRTKTFFWGFHKMIMFANYYFFFLAAAAASLFVDAAFSLEPESAAATASAHSLSRAFFPFPAFDVLSFPGMKDKKLHSQPYTIQEDLMMM